MLSVEEKQGLTQRAREAFKEAAESNGRSIEAAQRARDAFKDIAEAMESAVGKGRLKKITVNETIAQLRQEGRELEADRLATLVKTAEDAREEQEKVQAETETIEARAGAFVADLKLHGLLQ